MQAGREPHDWEIDESTSDVVPLHPGYPTIQAGIGDVRRADIDDGKSTCLSSVGACQSEFGVAS